MLYVMGQSEPPRVAGVQTPATSGGSGPAWQAQTPARRAS